MPDTKTQVQLDEQFMPEVIPVGLPWRLLVFTIIILAFSITIYFGLRFGYESYLTQQADSVDKQISQLTSQVNQQDQQNFINFYSQLINLKTVLAEHGFSGNVFSFLERDTTGSVYYTGADYSLADNSLSLIGVAASLDALVQQMNVFDKAPELASVTLDQANASSKGGINFNISLIFNSNFFNQPQ